MSDLVTQASKASGVPKNDAVAEGILRRLRDISKNREVVPTSRLSDLQLDSLDLIESLFELEQESGRFLSHRELATIRTVADLINLFDVPIS